MPIQYYCGITMNQNSIVTPVIDPLGTAPSVGTEVEGQQYYNTATNLMYFWNGTAWVEMDGTGSGVLSISIAAAGTNAGGINTSLVIDSSTSANTLQPMQFGGSANIGMVPDASGGTDSVKFLKGDGTWATPGGGGTMSTWLIEADGANSQTVSDGDTLDVVGSTYLTSVASSPAANNFMVQISHDLTSRTDTTSAASPAYGAAFSAVDSVTTNSTGHVTALNLKTVTLPAASSRWTAVGETGSEVVSYGDTVNFLNDTNGGIDTKVDTSTADVSVLLKMDVNDLSTLASPATGDFIPLADISDSGNTKKATIANIIALAPQGTVESVAGGTYLTNSGSATAVVLNHDLTSRSDTTSTASPAAGATFTAVDSVTSNSTGHVTALNLKTVTLPSDTNTTYALDKAAGSTNLILSAGGTTQDTIQFTAKNSSFTVTGVTEDVYAFGLADDVTIAGELTVSGTGQSSFGGQVTIPQTPVAGTDAASKAYVLAQVGGVGAFQGGYNATTNVPVITGASNIALNQGDFYVVTIGGSFYTDTVEPGDLIFANADITASSSPASTAYTVVIADENIAGSGTTDGNTVKGVAGFNSAHFNVTANGWVSSDIYGGGSTLGIVPSGGGGTTFLRGDGTWVVPTDTDTTYTAGVGLTLTGTVFDANVDGTQSVAANTSSTTASRTYNVQVSSTDKLVVNVPWSDSNTGLTSVGITETGNALTITNSPLTVNGNINIAGAGTSSQYIDGDLNLQTFPTIPQGDVTGVNASTSNDELGIIVASSTGPVPVVGLDIAGLTAIGDAGTTNGLTEADTLAIYDVTSPVGPINKKVTVGQINRATSYAVTISSMGTVTHSLNSFDVVVQLYNDTTKETIEACVDRATVDTVAISGSVFPAGNIRVLVSKIG
jgi:hypothetical protein